MLWIHLPNGLYGVRLQFRYIGYCKGANFDSIMISLLYDMIVCAKSAILLGAWPE